MDPSRHNRRRDSLYIVAELRFDVRRAQECCSRGFAGARFDFHSVSVHTLTPARTTSPGTKIGFRQSSCQTFILSSCVALNDKLTTATRLQKSLGRFVEADDVTGWMMAGLSARQQRLDATLGSRKPPAVLNVLANREGFQCCGSMDCTSKAPVPRTRFRPPNQGPSIVSKDPLVITLSARMRWRRAVTRNLIAIRVERWC